MTKSRCPTCQGVEWVCENHSDRPWSDAKPNGCRCGAGMPCPTCNVSEGEHDPPRTGEVISDVDVSRGRGRAR